MRGPRLEEWIIAVALVAIAFSAGCGSPGGQSATSPLPLNQPRTVLAPGVVQPTAHPLVAKYDIAVPLNASVTVEFGPDQQYGRKTWARPAPAGGGNVSILVAGMRPHTVYHLRGRVDLPDGRSLYDVDHPFTTGDLPQLRFPQITVSQPDALLKGGGVDLLSSFNPGDVGVGAVVADGDGSVLWYYPRSSPFPLRLLSNGDFLMDFGADLAEVDLTGSVVRQLAIDELNSSLAAAGYSLHADFFHHDCLRLDNGHWIVLVQEQRDFVGLAGFPGTTTVISDALVDLDENNRPVWVWRAFDHLDVNRHPYLFPDWTHSNAIEYTRDGNLLLSIRHQNWVVKIDYANGNGSGNIVWRLGPDGDFALSGGDPAQWFYDQHFPQIFAAQGVQFRMGIFDNGNMRPDATGQPCWIAGDCYSRAVIYDVDETARTAAVSWQYAPGWYSFWGGSISMLANGNVEFDSSSVNGGASRIVEVSAGPDAHVVWQMDTDSHFYRAYRVPSLYPGVQW